MEVRPRRVAGRADASDALTGRDLLADTHAHARKV
jgi:hypothetical protein